MTPFQTASERLGAFCAVVIIARIKSGNLVLPGERVYNISEEEAPPPPYKGREILPPYVEVAAPKTQDICSSLRTSTEPAQQRSREAGERISPPMAAPASCLLRLWPLMLFDLKGDVDNRRHGEAVQCLRLTRGLTPRATYSAVAIQDFERSFILLGFGLRRGDES
ncbi:hypothetical protein R3P38DRAFT_2772508 [Favolaschia claudopus]|uniref:Uncharacterized protein n=1 Tax=Favolaschia claudopus TaxID=2862362 RepID=A0AAW0C6Y5_9AGAR